MKGNQFRVPLVARSVYDCLDLGLKFFGQHVVQMLKLWLWVAIPTLSVVYAMTAYGEMHLGHALLVVYLVSGVWSVLLVQKAVQTSFGRSFEMYPANRRELGGMLTMMAKAFGLRLLTLLAGVFLILPGWWLAVRSSFFVEKDGLSEWREGSSDRRTGRLVKQEFSQLLTRSAIILVYLMMYVFSIFLTIDFLVDTVFQVSLFWGRLTDPDMMYYYDELGIVIEFFRLLVEDPAVVTLFCGVILLMYPVGRFAWFFSYIDLRVRGDFWDLELLFQNEVARLQEAKS